MKIQRKHIMYLLLLINAVLITACGSKSGSNYKLNNSLNQQDDEYTNQEEIDKENTLYVVETIDLDKKNIMLINLKSNRQEEYQYTGGTYILDKYNNNLTISQIPVGEVIQIELTLKYSKLSKIQVSDEVFYHDDISEYAFDQEKNKLRIGNTDYFYDKNVHVFSDKGEVPISELGEHDVVSIRGQDKKIFSIMIVKGHGTLTFDNIQLYEGGFITIGNILSEKLTKELQVEVTEGTHLLSATNDGYIGYIEITVMRNEELVVDLETLEQEMPKTCNFTIRVTPSDATVTFDGEDVDLSRPVVVKYGTYRIKAVKDGYVTWDKNIAVSSRAASLSIVLKEDKPEEEETQPTQPEGDSQTVRPQEETQVTQPQDDVEVVEPDGEIIDADEDANN